jgi:hypothetical protein
VVDSASKRNEYQEYFRRSKGGQCPKLKTLLPSCAECLAIWEPQGLFRPVQGLLYLYKKSAAIFKITQYRYNDSALMTQAARLSEKL